MQMEFMSVASSVEMNQSYLLCLLLTLLIAASYGTYTLQTEDFAPLELGEDDAVWNEDETKKLLSPALHSYGAGITLVNVDSLGAAGDGITDDTEAFVSAWRIACNTSNSVFLVPEGRRYLVKAVRFKGPCADGNLIVQIAGEIVAPDEPREWDPKNPRTWLLFWGLNGVSFQGGGLINGTGGKWWASSCKRNKTNPCREAPTALTIASSSAVRVSNLHLRDSQQIHFTINRCKGVVIYDLDIQAPGNSPNTDGVHVSHSTNLLILNSKIATGDDCISIVNGTSNIKMKNIICGPGHGISIGSLGKDNSTGIVTGVVLDTAVLTETTNGVRIKTWQGGSGYAKALSFQNVQMNNVSYPIIIDQFYCDSKTPCKNQTSAVSISQVTYMNISGTSRTAHAIKFSCSNTVPCSKLYLTNINLEGIDDAAETFCNSASIFKSGSIVPSVDCKVDQVQTPHDDDKSSTTDAASIDIQETQIIPATDHHKKRSGIIPLEEIITEDHIIHTEL